VATSGRGKEETMRPFLDFLDGASVPPEKLVEAGRKLAEGLVNSGHPVFLCGDGPWQGVWVLDRLTDTQAITWGLWVASKVRGRTTRP
jgi:hypothetical protein